MGFATFPRQTNLFLALSEGSHLLVSKGAKAARTGDTVFVMRVGAVLGAHRIPTRMAEFVIAYFKRVTNTDAFVEHKTLAFPEAFRLWHRFEVFQNSALQMEDLINAERFHI